MPSILIVDDEQSVRSFVATVMKNRGWQVKVADSVASGLMLARNTHPDLVLCDVVMPRQGGAELVKEMHTELPDVPVLLMSGHPTAHLAEEETMPHWWRPVPLLEKPFSIGELERAVEFTIQNH